MGCGSSKIKYPSFDINAAVPSSKDSNLKKIDKCIKKKGKSVLEALKNYKGCEAVIRKAITNPTPEAENEALVQLVPVIDVLHDFYKFSQKIESYLPTLFEPLCSDTPIESIVENMGTVRILGDILNFALRFDDLKMVNPAIQNDFSYYRRTLSRLKLSKQSTGVSLHVTGEVANRMSLFFAYPTPMMRVLLDTTAKFIAQEQRGSQLIVGLGHLTNMFITNLNEAAKANVQPSSTTLKVVAYISGAIVLYDQACPDGAFIKSSPIMIKDALKNVKMYSQNQPLFMNAIRFTTAHFNDASTPDNIKNF